MKINAVHLFKSHNYLSLLSKFAKGLEILNAMSDLIKQNLKLMFQLEIVVKLCSPERPFT